MTPLHTTLAALGLVALTSAAAAQTASVSSGQDFSAGGRANAATGYITIDSFSGGGTRPPTPPPPPKDHSPDCFICD